MSKDDHPDRGRLARLNSLKWKARHLALLEAELAAMPYGAERAAMEVRLKEFRWTVHILMLRSVSSLQRSKAH